MVRRCPPGLALLRYLLLTLRVRRPGYESTTTTKNPVASPHHHSPGPRLMIALEFVKFGCSYGERAIIVVYVQL